MRTRLVFALLILAGFLLPAPAAFAAALPTDCNPHSPQHSCLKDTTLTTCTQLGESTMDGDNGNLIVCLLKDPPTDNTKVWKAMNGGGTNDGPQGSLCGLWAGGYSNAADGSSSGGPYIDVPCKGYDIGFPAIRAPSCPPGYGIHAITGMLSEAIYGNLYSCVKQ
jgi:hypothetical protein